MKIITGVFYQFLTSNSVRDFDRFVPAIFVVKFVFIMASPPVCFPVPQTQEGLDERETLDCFILYYVDYCTVMGWFLQKLDVNMTLQKVRTERLSGKSRVYV